MKKIQFDYFRPGQEIWFNIGRLTMAEEMAKMPMGQLIGQELSLKTMCILLAVGLRHDGVKSPSWYAEKLQDGLDAGDFELQDIQMDLVKAIVGSGIMGKQAYYNAFPAELTDCKAEEVEKEKNA